MEGESWIRGGVLGAGSFGTVYLAVSKVDGSLFAAKSVSIDSHFGELESIENEISILESLGSCSPHIVGFLGSETSPRARSAFLELMAGGSVADLMSKLPGGRIEESLARIYAAGILRGLKHIHECGIVHCDVKARNVLVGSSGEVKIADFGSAKRLGSSPSIKGTPLWMAPEVARQEQQDAASDMWSFGCTMVEMLSGAAPWSNAGCTDGTTSFATLYKIACSEETPELPSGISDSCKDFIARCLCRDPLRRATAAELLEHEFIVGKASAKLEEETEEEVVEVVPPSSPKLAMLALRCSATSSSDSSSRSSSSPRWSSDSSFSPNWITVHSPSEARNNSAFDCLSDFEEDVNDSNEESLAPSSEEKTEEECENEVEIEVPPSQVVACGRREDAKCREDTCISTFNFVMVVAMIINERLISVKLAVCVKFMNQTKCLFTNNIQLSIMCIKNVVRDDYDLSKLSGDSSVGRASD